MTTRYVITTHVIELDLIHMCLYYVNIDFQITEWTEVDRLKPLVKIQTVYFERNPIHKDTSYRTKLKLALPTLIQIDATPCR